MLSSGLGSVLVNKGHLTPEQLQQAETSRAKNNSSLGEQLLELGLISEKDLAQTVSQEYGIPIIQLEKYKIDESVRDLISDDLARKHAAVPLVMKNDKLLVGMVDPSDMNAITELKFATGMTVKGVVASRSAIKRRQKEIYKTSGSAEKKEEVSDTPPTLPRMPGQKIYYSHSGATSIFGLILMAVNGLVSGTFLGCTYAGSLYLIPWVYINICFCAGVGYAMGLSIAAGATWGETRNPWLVGLFGFAAGTLAYYWAWVVWIYLTTEHGYVTAPEQIMAIINEIALEGQWGLFDWWPTGGQLKAVWGAEALIIIGCSTILPVLKNNENPYCERCKCWLDSPYVMRLQAMANAKEFVQRLEGADFSTLAWLHRVDLGARDYTDLELRTCPKCHDLHTLTLKSVKVIEDDDGQKQNQETVHVQNLLINQEVCSWIRRKCGLDASMV